MYSLGMDSMLLNSSLLGTFKLNVVSVEKEKIRIKILCEESITTTELNYVISFPIPDGKNCRKKQKSLK